MPLAEWIHRRHSRQRHLDKRRQHRLLELAPPPGQRRFVDVVQHRKLANRQAGLPLGGYKFGPSGRWKAHEILRRGASRDGR